MSVIDDFMADSHRFCKVTLLKPHARKAIEEEFARQRLELMRTKRFRLDDEFVRMATEVSCKTTPKDLLARMGSALLPYEHTWIEYNPRVKVQASIDHGGISGRKTPANEVPDKSGILLRRDPNRSTGWSASMFQAMRIEGRSVTKSINLCLPAFNSFFFDASGRREGTGFGGILPIDKCIGKYGELFQESSKMLAEDLKSLAWGYVKVEDFREGMQAPGKMHAFIPKIIEPHSDVGVSRCGVILLEQIMNHTDLTEREKVLGLQEWSKGYVSSLLEASGMVRWLVTLLSMLNEVPTEVRSVEPRGSVRVGDHFRKELPYEEITLRLPRVKNRARYVARKIAGGGRKRRHEVIAHWRSYIPDEMKAPRKEGGIKLDDVCPSVLSVVPIRDHEWKYDNEDRLHRTCLKCETFQVRVLEHARGDESLGWVRKSYVIKGKEEHREAAAG